MVDISVKDVRSKFPKKLLNVRHQTCNVLRVKSTEFCYQKERKERKEGKEGKVCWPSFGPPLALLWPSFGPPTEGRREGGKDLLEFVIRLYHFLKITNITSNRLSDVIMFEARSKFDD